VRTVTFSLLFLWCIALMAQDNTGVFTPEKFIWMVQSYHPLVKQAELLKAKGENSISQARGNFDPQIFTNYDQKYFDDKTYYQLLNSGLRIPTWFGLELKTGYDQYRGAFLNPENNLPNGGLVYGGISLPIGQGLIIDQRRATLKQAQIYAESTVAEQNAMLNDLYFNALSQYWEWVQSWHQLQVYETSLSLAQTRFEAIKETYLLGDIPAIDTLEAFIQVQNRQMNRDQHRLTYQNNTLELSYYLWGDNLIPLEITENLKPADFNEVNIDNPFPIDTLNTLLANLDELNPELQLYDYQLRSFEIEQRVRRDQLKPRININYNLLNEPIGSNVAANMSMQNYTWGLEFAFPLFLRRERANLTLTKLKIVDIELDRKQKSLGIKNKVEQYYNSQNTAFSQVQLYTNAVENYYKLLAGEREKFNNGESSLFLINAREIMAIDAEITLIKLQTTYQKDRLGMYWAAGLLGDD
jgi:outer membrane protein TolC